jgi:hypothetical protein
MDRFSQLVHAESEIRKGLLQDFSWVHGGHPFAGSKR